MSLLPEQIELLEKMVEGARGVPRIEQEFTLICAPTMGSGALGKCTMEGPGIEPTHAMELDVWGLHDAGYLVGKQTSQHVSHFVITADGFEFYEDRRSRPTDPVAAVDDETERYLDAERFRRRFPAAYAKLRSASELLWQTKPSDDVTKIGHTLREALQRFATEMVNLHRPSEVDPDPDHTKNRLAAVVRARRDALGERKAELLVAIVAYVEAVNGVIQRLEHADQKAGDPATWDDARSACFQTINLFVEFDRLIND